MLPRLILASKSPRRFELLKQAGLKPIVKAADTDEVIDSTQDINAEIIRLAKEKAQWVLDNSHSHDTANSIILAADTMVYLDQHLLGKPADQEDAFRMIKALSGNTHEVITAYVIFDTRTHAWIEDYEKTKVCFRQLNDDEVKNYVSTPEPMDKAGAYAIQGSASSFVSRIEGSYTNVIGLPLAQVMQHLSKIHRA